MIWKDVRHHLGILPVFRDKCQAPTIMERFAGHGKNYCRNSVSSKTSDISCCVVPLAPLLDHECCTVFNYFLLPLRTYDPLPLRDDSILLFCYVEIIVRLRVLRVKLNRGSVRLLVS